jgi:hypothetical protein
MNGRLRSLQKLKHTLQEDAWSEHIDEWERIGMSRTTCGWQLSSGTIRIRWTWRSRSVWKYVSELGCVTVSRSLWGLAEALMCGFKCSSMTSNAMMLPAAQDADWNKTGEALSSVTAQG